MSQQPEGYGWWLADDGLWYPPERHPDPNYAAQFEPPATPPPFTPPGGQPDQPPQPQQSFGQPVPPIPSQSPPAWGQSVPTYQSTHSYSPNQFSAQSSRRGSNGGRVALLIGALIVVIGGLGAIAYFGLRGSDDDVNARVDHDEISPTTTPSSSTRETPDGVSYDLTTGVENLPSNLSSQELIAHMYTIRDRSLAAGDDFCAYYRIVAVSLTQAGEQILGPFGSSVDVDAFAVFIEISVDVRARMAFFTRDETQQADIQRNVEILQMMTDEPNLMYANLDPSRVDVPPGEMSDLQHRSLDVWTEMVEVESTYFRGLEIDSRFEDEC